MSAQHEEYEEKEHTEPDNINVGLVATVTVVGAVLTLSIALALTALVRNEASSHSNEVGAFADLGTVARLKAEQQAKLEQGPTWAKKEDGLVALPIDRAMQLVTADIRKNPALATKAPPGEEQTPADAGADGAVTEGAGGDEPNPESAQDEPAAGDPSPPAPQKQGGDPAPAPKGKPALEAPKTSPGPKTLKREQAPEGQGAMPASVPAAPAAPSAPAKGPEN